MNLLIVNPNISESVTDLIHAEALRTAAPETHITMATAQFGVAYIERALKRWLAAMQPRAPPPSMPASSTASSSPRSATRAWQASRSCSTCPWSA